MIKKRLNEIVGDEILAKPVMTWDYQIIIPQGAPIKKDYVEKLKELGVTEVYVRESEVRLNEIAILRSDVEESVKEKVKDILERHTYHHNQELIELSKTADNIINNILEEDRVIEKIFDIKERSADLYEHSISICSLSILTALKMKLDQQKIHDIGVGCLLHDLGLRYITVEFENKDFNEMNPQEVIEYKKHPVYGYSSIKAENWIPNTSKAIILYHHERMDGSGYPIHPKDIPYECKIVNVCDTFDEMICGIANKKMKVYEAIEYLKAYKGISFDSDAVDAFLSFTAVYPAGSKIKTNEGEIAIVISQNKDFQNRPIIRILKDKYGNDVTNEKIVDLIKTQNIFIEEVLDD